MFFALILAAPLLLPFAQDSGDEPAAPSKEEVVATCAALESAYRSGEEEAILAALEKARSVPDGAVVRAVLDALDDERQKVRLGGLEALRWLDHPEALKALHRLTRDRDVTRDPVTMAALLRAHGQHASPSSVEFLGKAAFTPDDHACRKTRVLALGRIRTRESVEALIGILGVVNPKGEPRIQPQLQDARLSLMLLTGVDRGLSAPLWEEWWRDNRRTFEVPEEVPLLPREMQQSWDSYWGLPPRLARTERREDRGKGGGKD